MVFNPLSPPVRQPATLPGVASTAPYEYYSGYLNAGVPPSGHGLMFFHYICAMAPAWQSKPLSIWYNGGPGAPSTFGLFQEFGPYLLTSESLTTAEYKQTNIPTPLFNPWTSADLEPEPRTSRPLLNLFSRVRVSVGTQVGQLDEPLRDRLSGTHGRIVLHRGQRQRLEPRRPRGRRVHVRAVV